MTTQCQHISRNPHGYSNYAGSIPAGQRGPCIVTVDSDCLRPGEHLIANENGATSLTSAIVIIHEFSTGKFCYHSGSVALFA